ncbi:hypothetical protein COEREDRAFT_87763 [Coemansia reversa NRRL 1564]|uniref:Uncharacterized protein n=1 Tax=Coemansia reversa (strain ATCC 12441 / NRRL 1564) TaxID=763665 RepID=A0A2G5B991_COERN|nr:hypothetical protein COEREDRAFT_87763 [Coemansia reversa NRRL 1564]|eukprot:PIA15578.1 hypothetical protein COEREDRAFT_87763 [Coemansia reversa NRRL 1564]
MYIAVLALSLMAPIVLANSIKYKATDYRNTLLSRIQWPWSSKRKIETAILESPFDFDVSSTSPKCLWAVWTASLLFDTTCFQNKSARETSSLTNEQADKSSFCNSCTKEWAEAIKSSKYKISPLLYYGHIPDAARLASWISEQCDYHLTPL